MSEDERTVDRLLEVAGRTFADEAGVRLADQPAPLYRLLVLSVLLSSPVQAGLGVAAFRELVDAGMGTPRRMREAGWQARVDALGRARFRRLDEQTATALGEGAGLVLDRWGGDLRRIRRDADGDRARLRELLTELPRLGPTGADVFLREVQAVWPELRPHLDDKALDGARAVGLPDDPARLAGLVDGDRLARLGAALVRAGRERAVARQVRGEESSSPP